VSVTDPHALLAPDAPFRKLAERAPVMLWVSNPEAGVLMLNPGWRAFRGLALDINVPGSWAFGIHEDDAAVSLEAFRHAHDTRAPYEAEYRVRRADGQFRWIHDSGSPWFDAHGTFMGFIGCCIDITDQHNMRSAASNAERRLKTLIENSPDVVYRVRLVPSLALEYLGGAVETMTGYTADELCSDISLALNSVHPDDLSELALTPDAAAQMRSTVTNRWLHKDGRTLWAEHYRMPVFDAAGEVVGLEGIARR